MPEACNKGATVTAKKLLTLVATYKAHISIQLMLDHVILGSFLGHVGGGKWPQDEAKTMPCAVYFYNTYYDNSAVYSKSLLKLFKRFRITQLMLPSVPL